MTEMSVAGETRLSGAFFRHSLFLPGKAQFLIAGASSTLMC